MDIKIPNKIAFTIIFLFIISISTAFYFQNNLKPFLKTSQTQQQNKTNTPNNPTPPNGNKYVNLGNGNGTFRADECMTDDFKYVDYSLKRVIYTVKLHDNLWNILSYNLDQQELVRKLTAAELSKVLDSVKDRMQSMSSEEIKGIGISSGDINALKDGDRINISPLLLDISKIYEKTNINPLKFRTSSQYKKNNKYVCWEKVLLKGADPESFIAFDNGRSMDKNTIYSNWSPLSGVDPNSLIFLDKSYSMDNNSVYYRENKIEGADINSFQASNSAYAKDDRYVYFLGTKLEGVDSNKILIMEPGPRLKFGDNIYFGKDKIAGVNADKFTPIDSVYSKDDKRVYHLQFAIANADPESFQVFNINYSKDKNNIYCNGRKLSNADITTFKIHGVGERVDAEDANFTYNSCNSTLKSK